MRDKNGKTDYKIPMFGFKSAIILIVAATIGTIIVPYILSLANINFKSSVIICNSIITAGAVAYTRCFIESNVGICKRFWLIYSIFSMAFGLISFFWVHMNVYI